MHESPSVRSMLGALGFVAGCLAGCSTPRDMAGIAGTYVMNQTRAADTLRLRPDGRFVRHYAVPDEQAFTDSGAWFLTRDRRLVGLRGFPKRWAFVHDLMGDTTGGKMLTVPSTLSLTIGRSRAGTLRLGWHPDWGWWYVRVADRGL